jgi:hypothetical protein
MKIDEDAANSLFNRQESRIEKNENIITQTQRDTHYLQT